MGWEGLRLGVGGDYCEPSGPVTKTDSSLRMRVNFWMADHPGLKSSERREIRSLDDLVVEQS